MCSASTIERAVLDTSWLGLLQSRTHLLHWSRMPSKFDCFDSEVRAKGNQTGASFASSTNGVAKETGCAVSWGRRLKTATVMWPRAMGMMRTIYFHPGWTIDYSDHQRSSLLKPHCSFDSTASRSHWSTSIRILPPCPTLTLPTYSFWGNSDAWQWACSIIPQNDRSMFSQPSGDLIYPSGSAWQSSMSNGPVPGPRNTRVAQVPHIFNVLGASYGPMIKSTVRRHLRGTVCAHTIAPPYHIAENPG